MLSQRFRCSPDFQVTGRKRHRSELLLYLLLWTNTLYVLSAVCLRCSRPLLCPSATQPTKLWHDEGRLVNLRKADYTEGGRMLEMWAWLSPTWIMMWTLIQRDGQRDCGWGIVQALGSGQVYVLQAVVGSVCTKLATLFEHWMTFADGVKDLKIRFFLL